MSANFDPFGDYMGAAQTEYYVEPPAGVPGQQTFIADQPVSIWSCPVQTGPIVFGRAVARGTAITVAPDTFGQQVSPFGIVPLAAGAAATDVYGLAVWDAGGRRDFATGQPSQHQHKMQGVMKKGYMFVELFQDTVAEAQAFVVINATNSINAPVGAIVANDLGGAAVTLPGVNWWATYATANTPVGVIKIDL